MERRDILKILEMAMQIEDNGYEFYTKSAESVTDPKGREMLKHLADEEKVHKKTLEEYYDAIKSDKKPELPERTPWEMEKPESICEEEIENLTSDRIFKTAIEGKKSDLEVLQMAIQIEENSIKLYREASSKCSRESKEAFDILLEEEKDHLKNLKIQYLFLEKHGFWYDPNVHPS